jgi:hypothetical protein
MYCPRLGKAGMGAGFAPALGGSGGTAEKTAGIGILLDTPPCVFIDRQEVDMLKKPAGMGAYWCPRRDRIFIK